RRAARRAFKLFGNELGARRQHATVSGETFHFGRVGVIVLRAAQLELTARLDDGLGARGVAFAGELDQDFVLTAACESDGGLGEAEGVDAATDGFERLVHCFALDL